MGDRYATQFRDAHTHDWWVPQDAGEFSRACVTVVTTMERRTTLDAWRILDRGKKIAEGYRYQLTSHP